MASDLEAARLLTTRVSDAGRLTKVMEAQARGPQAVRYGVFGFCPAAVASDTAEAGASLNADWLTGLSDIDGAVTGSIADGVNDSY